MTPHKLNVLSSCDAGIFISPRKVRERVAGLGGGIELYLTDLWIYHRGPGRPFKYRRAAALVIRIPAHDNVPELCWQVADCKELRTKQDAADYYVGVIKQLACMDEAALLHLRDRQWHDSRFMSRQQRRDYTPVYMETKDAKADIDYYAEYRRYR